VTGPDCWSADAFDGVVEDDGVLEPADSLATDRLDADVLDTGVDAAMNWAGATRFGTTLAEQQRGEGLDRLLGQEEPDVDSDAAWTDEDAPSDDGRSSLPRAGRLVAADEGAGAGEDADLFAVDVGIDGGAASAEEAAVHITDEPECAPGPADLG
jgi:hypothetical protein